MRRPHRARFVPLTAASAVTALALAACGSTSASTTSSTSSAKPITVGISLPLTGDFAADGQATRNGYELWASDVNTHGGLLGRPVRLKILNDKSNEKLVVSQYTQLITQDHVDLTLAPFSTLLTADALKPTSKYNYALPAGSATGGLVFGATGGPTYRNLFSVSVPAASVMTPFANWVTTLPPGDRQTAAYPMVDDPFADPPVQNTQAFLQKHGVHTVYSHVAEPGQIQAEANQVTHLHPDIVVIGSVDLPSLMVFVHTFQNAHYTPKVMIAASGPDQGQAFLNKLNPINATGIMVPDAWSGQSAERAEPRDGAGLHRQVRRHRVRHQRRRRGGVLSRRGPGRRGHRDQGPEQREDHQLPAQPEHGVADGAGTGEVHGDRPEHRPDRLHLPVAERRPVQPGAARERARVESRSWPPSRNGARAADLTGSPGARPASTTTS